MATDTTEQGFTAEVQAIVDSEEFGALTPQQLQELALAVIDGLSSLHAAQVAQLVEDGEAEEVAVWAADEARLELAADALISVDLGVPDEEAEAA
jgi:predicted GTPase